MKPDSFALSPTEKDDTSEELTELVGFAEDADDRVADDAPSPQSKSTLIRFSVVASYQILA